MKKWQLFGTTAIGASLLLGACGGGGNADSGKGEGEVKGDGSSTVGPIIEKLNEKFAKDNKDVTVSSGTSGTGGGFEKFINSIVHCFIIEETIFRFLPNLFGLRQFYHFRS